MQGDLATYKEAWVEALDPGTLFQNFQTVAVILDGPELEGLPNVEKSKFSRVLDVHGRVLADVVVPSHQHLKRCPKLPQRVIAFVGERLAEPLGEVVVHGLQLQPAPNEDSTTLRRAVLGQDAFTALAARGSIDGLHTVPDRITLVGRADIRPVLAARADLQCQ